MKEQQMTDKTFIDKWTEFCDLSNSLINSEVADVDELFNCLYHKILNKDWQIALWNLIDSNNLNEFISVRISRYVGIGDKMKNYVWQKIGER